MGYGVEEIKELVNQGLVKQTFKKTHGGSTVVGSGLGQMQLDPKTVKQLEAAADDAVKKTPSQLPSGTQQQVSTQIIKITEPDENKSEK